MPSQLPALTNVAQVRGLSADAARAGRPVRLRGVVTYYDPHWGILFVQDATGGIFVEPAGQQFEMRPGMGVEVVGVSAAGDYKPILVRPSVRVGPRAPLPAAVPVSWDELFAGRADSQWVSLSGIVRSVGEQEGRVRLQLAQGERRLKVILQALAQGADPELVGATVRLTGVCGTIANGKGRFLAPQLFVPSWDQVRIEKPAPSDVFTLPITRVINLHPASTSATRPGRVHLFGWVAGFKTNAPLVLEDGTGSAEIRTLAPVVARDGVALDAVGFVASNHTGVVLEDAVIRRLGFGSVPLPTDPTNSARASLSGPSLPVLTTASRLRRLSPEAAARGYPVQLRGVVTYYDADWGVLFLQGASGGIFVDTEGQPLDLAAGDLVSLYGYSGPGEFAPVVRRPLFRVEGKAPMPPVALSTFGQLVSGREDSQWVSILGMVRSMSHDWGHVRMKLATGSGGLTVILPGFGHRPLPEHLVATTVQVQGVCGSLFDSRRRMVGIQLFVPSLADITVEEAAAGGPGSLPVQSISSIMRFNPEGLAHQARIQGVVTLFRDGQYLYVQDQSDTICVHTVQTGGARVGDRVDVVGFPAMGHYSRVLMDATFRRIGRGQMPTPLPVTADRVLREGLDGALVQIDGYLFDTFAPPDERVLVLESAYGVFLAHLEQPKGADPFHGLTKGSWLRVTGICSVDVDSARQPKSFQILLRTPADVQLLAGPSWWTLRHISTVVGLLAAAGLLAAGWGMTLNHRVRRQTELIQTRWRHEAALQARYQELFENSKRTETLYRRAIMAAGAVPYHRDYEANVFTYFGEAIQDLTGYSRGELTPEIWESLIQEYQFHGPLAGLSYADAVARVRSGQVVQWQCDCRILTRDGRTRWIADASVEILDHRGQVIGSIGMLQDITERRQAEEQFFRTQRLESIGTLASGIAHDLNNVLAPILMSAEMLQTDALDEPAHKLVRTIESTARRGADIVRQVLTFARGAEGEKIPLQPAHVVNDVVKLLRETFPKNITLAAQVPRDLWTVTANPTQLHQVLLNLCLNARDAMATGGALEISAENADLDEHFAAMVPGAKTGPHFALRVRDTGAGIASGILDKIFDPFFTTKPPGHGTGLGLSTVSGIVKGHGGFITVDSRVRQGSTFTVYLPASPTAATAAAPSHEGPPPRGRGEVVLVVDDEPEIREVTARMLHRQGYRVLVAADGAEALSLFVRHRQDIHLVLTDLMMPNMDGPALVRVLRQMAPTLKIVASSGGVSGFNEAAGTDALAGMAVNAFLRKPFTADELLQTLHTSLATEQP